jgi:alpha-beta hydrolase superfamily lysophospholipase
MGGNLIQMHLTTESAAGAVIMCTSTCDDVRKAGPKMLRYPFAVLKYLLTGNMEHFFHNREICRQVFFAGDKSQQTEYALDHITLQPESNLVLNQLMYLETGKFKDAVPTLIIGGGKDSSIPKKSLEARAVKYDGQLKFYEDRCHEFFLLEGWEDVARDVLEWVQNVHQAAA